MKRIRMISLSIAALMALASLYYRSMGATLSVLAGSAIVIASFELLYLIVRKAMAKNGKPAAFIVIAALLKFTLLGIVIWYVVSRVQIHALAFTAGLSTIVFAIIADEAYGLITGSRNG